LEMYWILGSSRTKELDQSLATSIFSTVLKAVRHKFHTYLTPTQEARYPAFLAT
jgi:hypothetical protein